MSIGEYTALGAFAFTVVGIVWRMSYLINQKVSYTALDRCKADLAENYRTKDVCNVLYSGMKEDIIEIKKDVKELLKKANGKV
jgi:hypothetical protein